MCPIKDNSCQLMYKTVDWLDWWRTPYKIIYETTVDGWVQWRTIHARCCTKLLIELTGEGHHAIICTKQMPIDQSKKWLPMPDDAKKCWWSWLMKDSISDNARNNCWWMSSTKFITHARCGTKLLMDYTSKGTKCQMMYEQLLMDVSHKG